MNIFKKIVGAFFGAIMGFGISLAILLCIIAAIIAFISQTSFIEAISKILTNI